MISRYSAAPLLVVVLSISMMGDVSHAVKLAEKGTEEEAKLVTMDFRGVDLSTIIKLIGELTGKNFIIDERVRGKVTIISPNKISVQEVYKVFESILEVHGYATVPSGKVIKVVPATDARGKSIVTRVGTETLPTADTMITQIIPISYANVNDVKTLFTPLVSKDSLLVTYQPTSTLIVTDVLSNINKLLTILKQVDVSGYVLQLAVIPLNYASAQVVAQELKSIFEGRKGVPHAPRPKTVVNNRLLAHAIENTKAEVREGSGIAPALRQSGLFPALVTHMIATDEASGDLAKMLLKVADAHDAEVETKVTALTSILEPLIILAMGLVVGFIVISILLPIFEMNQLVR